MSGSGGCVNTKIHMSVMMPAITNTGLESIFFDLISSSNPNPARIDNDRQNRKRILVGVPVERIGMG